MKDRDRRTANRAAKLRTMDRDLGMKTRELLRPSTGVRDEMRFWGVSPKDHNKLYKKLISKQEAAYKFLEKVKRDADRVPAFKLHEFDGIPSRYGDANNEHKASQRLQTADSKCSAESADNLESKQTTDSLSGKRSNVSNVGTPSSVPDSRESVSNSGKPIVPVRHESTKCRIFNVPATPTISKREKSEGRSENTRIKCNNCGKKKLSVPSSKSKKKTESKKTNSSHIPGYCGHIPHTRMQPDLVGQTFGTSTKGVYAASRFQ
mmetsp:Transcript_37198/g.73082  ORF Transcript_37198/g.73082 Transcript_37198/m.73082 type:complete len:263 (+) Transcript_37198:171-959(+)